MNAIPFLAWRHFDTVLRMNFRISEGLSRFENINSGLTAIKSLYGVDFHSSFENTRRSLHRRIRPFYPNQFEDKVKSTHDTLLTIAAPFAIFGLSRSACTHLKNACEKNIPTFIRHYNLFQGVNLAGKAAIITNILTRKFSKLTPNPSIQQISGIASSILSNFYKVGCAAEIVVFAMEYRKPIQPRSCFGMDEDKMQWLDVSEEKQNDQLRLYRSMKLLQTINTIAKFAATFVFAAAPAAPIVIMGTVIARMILEAWWEHKVSLFKSDCGLVEKEESRISQVARVVSLAATPLLFVPSTAIAAGVAITASYAADIYVQSVKAASSSRRPNFF
jgi:hypothetical protein